MRTFDSGATRDSDQDKLDFDGFLSPGALRSFAEYMHRHRIVPDGSQRASDNWKKGIPEEEYIKSLWRHFFEAWESYHQHDRARLKEALCGVFFNTQGLLHAFDKEEALEKSRSVR